MPYSAMKRFLTAPGSAWLLWCIAVIGSPSVSFLVSRLFETSGCAAIVGVFFGWLVSNVCFGLPIGISVYLRCSKRRHRDLGALLAVVTVLAIAVWTYLGMMKIGDFAYDYLDWR